MISHDAAEHHGFFAKKNFENKKFLWRVRPVFLSCCFGGHNKYRNIPLCLTRRPSACFLRHLDGAAHPPYHQHVPLLLSETHSVSDYHPKDVCDYETEAAVLQFD